MVAGGDVDVATVGSPQGGEVEIAAGVESEKEKTPDAAEEALAKVSSERRRLRQTLGGLVREPDRVVEIHHAERRARMAEMLRRYFDLDVQYKQLKSRRDELEKRTREAPETRIRVAQMVWRGAILRVGNAEHKMRRSRRGPLQYIAAGSSLVTV